MATHTAAEDRVPWNQLIAFGLGGRDAAASNSRAANPGVTCAAQLGTWRARIESGLRSASAT